MRKWRPREREHLSRRTCIAMEGPAPLRFWPLWNRGGGGSHLCGWPGEDASQKKAEFELWLCCQLPLICLKPLGRRRKLMGFHPPWRCPFPKQSPKQSVLSPPPTFLVLASLSVQALGPHGGQQLCLLSCPQDPGWETETTKVWEVHAFKKSILNSDEFIKTKYLQFTPNDYNGNTNTLLLLMSNHISKI